MHCSLFFNPVFLGGIDIHEDLDYAMNRLMKH